MRFALRAGVLLSLATAATASPLLRRQTTCYTGVYVIAGRGSEEAAGEGSTQQVADAIVAAIPGSGSIAVDYPASVFDPPYFDSVSDGINNVISLIQTYVSDCGGQIVLAGFSQGGNVMTDALSGGVDKPTPLDPSLVDYSELKLHDNASSMANGRKSLVSSSLATQPIQRASLSMLELPQTMVYVLLPYTHMLSNISDLLKRR